MLYSWVLFKYNSITSVEIISLTVEKTALKYNYNWFFLQKQHLDNVVIILQKAYVKFENNPTML